MRTKGNGREDGTIIDFHGSKDRTYGIEHGKQRCLKGMREDLK